MYAYLSNVKYSERQDIEKDVEDVDVRHRNESFIRRQNVLRRR